MAAKFLFALPVGVYLLQIVLGLTSAGFDPVTLVLSVAIWLVPFSSIFLFSALLFLAAREWVVRTVEVPSGEEFEMPLNRAHPLWKQYGSSPGAPGLGRAAGPRPIQPRMYLRSGR